MGGGICWYCHWGWARPVVDIYLRACADIDDVLGACEENDWTAPAYPIDGESALEFGPGHVVWSDENFNLAESCLEDFDQFPHLHADWHPPALEIVRRSLQELAALPLEVRCCAPKDYDGEHPEKYPPPADVEVVHKEHIKGGWKK